MNLTDAESLATSLMAEHGLTEKGWRFQFDGGKRRFGYCNYTKRIVSLSRHLVQLNDEDQVRDTILHEIAHALVIGEDTHSREHHGLKWQAVARSIGCNGMRCYDDTVAEPEGHWILTCPNCGYVTNRLRRRHLNIACSDCCNKYNGGHWHSDYKFVWTENHVQSLRISQ